MGELKIRQNAAVLSEWLSNVTDNIADPKTGKYEESEDINVHALHLAENKQVWISPKCKIPENPK